MSAKKIGVDFDMDGNQVTNLGIAVNANDALRKNEFDAHSTNTSNPHSTSLEQVRSQNNQVSGNIDMNNNKLINVATPTASGDAVNKGYVDGLVDNSLKAPEAYNPTITSNYPITYNALAVQKGDTFRITVAGTMGTRSVNIEDLLIALIDTPAQVDANWQVAESNRDQATETVKGVLEIADNAEALAGSNDTNAMTPLKTAAKLTNYKAAKVYNNTSFALTGGGTADTVTHNLGLSDASACIVATYLSGEQVDYKINVVNANSLTITKNGAGTTIKVTVVGF